METAVEAAKEHWISKVVEKSKEGKERWPAEVNMGGESWCTTKDL